jgi:hypothetical protein
MKKNDGTLEDVIIQKKSSKNIEYTDGMTEALYYNYFPIIKKEPWTLIRDSKTISHNVYGFRSPDFIVNPDFLFSGCSVTYGWGLNLKDLWHEKIAYELNCSYASVAMHGDSIPGQVMKIFAYIKQFGAPKHIVALFPDFNRFLSFNNKKMLASQTFFNSFDQDTYDWAKNGGNDYRTKEYLHYMYKNTAPVDPNQSTKDYFKRPLISDEVITQEISHMYASHYIHMLSEYCHSNNIKFVWSTWEEKTELLIKTIQNDDFFSDYLCLDASKWQYDAKLNKDIYDNIECHKEYNSIDNFNLANDTKLGVEHAHYGVHRHIHYYEYFLNYIKEKWL